MTEGLSLLAKPKSRPMVPMIMLGEPVLTMTLHDWWSRNWTPWIPQMVGHGRLTASSLRTTSMCLTTKTSISKSSAITMTTPWQVILDRQKPSNSLDKTSTGLDWDRWWNHMSALVWTAHAPKHHVTNNMVSWNNYWYLKNCGTLSPWTSLSISHPLMGSLPF